MTWFDDDTEMQNLGPHTGAASPFGQMKGVRDDGRDNIRPGMDVGGANPLWSKNGETPNPVSGQPKQSEAQKEVQKRTERAAAAGAEAAEAGGRAVAEAIIASRKKAEAKQKVLSREAAVKAEAARKLEEANRAAAATAAAKIADESKRASTRAAAATRNAARRATSDEAVHRRELNREHKEKMRDAEIGAEAAARMAEHRQRAREAEAASKEALRTEPEPPQSDNSSSR